MARRWPWRSKPSIARAPSVDVRVVLDSNVIVAALLSPDGRPAAIVRAWLAGEFELVVSEALLSELGRVLRYPKLAKHITPAEADALIDALERHALVVPDPPDPHPIRASDLADDFVIALAAAAGAVIVSGDVHLLDLADRIPVVTPSEFCDQFLETGT